MTLWAFLGFRLGFLQLYSLYECVIWCTIIQTSLILMDKLTPSPLTVSVVFFPLCSKSVYRVSTVPEHQNYGRMMDGKTNTLLLWSIRVGFISFNLLPISKERNIVWRNIFPASELPPARYQCQGSVNRQSRGSAVSSSCCLCYIHPIWCLSQVCILWCHTPLKDHITTW